MNYNVKMPPPLNNSISPTPAAPLLCAHLPGKHLKFNFSPFTKWNTSFSLFSGDQNNRNAFVCFQGVLISSSLKYMKYFPHSIFHFLTAWPLPLQTVSATISAASFSLLWQNSEVTPTRYLKTVSIGPQVLEIVLYFWLFWLLTLFNGIVAWHSLSNHRTSFLVGKDCTLQRENLTLSLTPLIARFELLRSQRQMWPSGMLRN